MPAIIHKYTTRLTSGSIKRAKYYSSKNSNANKNNTLDSENEDSANDDSDYELIMLCYLVAHLIVILLALVGVAGLAGYVWGML